jgi:hypothetical protein
MSRKTIVSLLAAGTLVIFALAPTSASAFGGPVGGLIGHTASFAKNSQATNRRLIWLEWGTAFNPGPHTATFTTIQPNGSLRWLSGRRPNMR